MAMGGDFIVWSFLVNKDSLSVNFVIYSYEVLLVSDAKQAIVLELF